MIKEIMPVVYVYILVQKEELNASKNEGVWYSLH
jgi:hypothetical protein